MGADSAEPSNKQHHRDYKPAVIDLINPFDGFSEIECCHYIISDGYVSVYVLNKSSGIDYKIPLDNIAGIECNLSDIHRERLLESVEN